MNKTVPAPRGAWLGPALVLGLLGISITMAAIGLVFALGHGKAGYAEVPHGAAAAAAAAKGARD